MKPRQTDHDDVLRLARASLASYAPLVYPSYRIYKHHSLLIRKLEAVERGEIKRLVVSMPPRHGKSLTASQIFPAWYLGRHPDQSVVVAGYSEEFAQSNFGRPVRNFCMDPRTRAAFPELVLAADSQSMKRFDTTAGGSFYAVGRGGPLTGRGAHVLIADDLLKDAAEAKSEVTRRELQEWFSRTAWTRKQPETAFIIIATRWHLDDLTGFLLREHSGENWDVVNLPAIAETDDSWRKAGDPLWPERFDLDELESTKRMLGTVGWASLYQGRPIPEDGAIFKAEWWQRYDEMPDFSMIILSADTAFKAGASNDYSVVTAWGVAKNGFYLLHIWRQRAEFPQLKRQLESMAAQFNPHAVLIEDKASGQSLIQELQQNTRLPIRPVKVDADKVTRAHAVSPLVEAGRVFLPKAAPWLSDFLDELSTFPAGAHDDIVDSVTQALNYLRTSNVAYGLLDFAKLLKAQPELAGALAAPTAKAGSAPDEQDRPACPEHPDAFMQRVSQGIRCSQCGLQLAWPPRKPEPLNQQLVRR